MKARKIVLRDVNGEAIDALDVSGLDHANTQAAMTLSVETMCDMNHWHVTQTVVLDPWGRQIGREP